MKRVFGILIGVSIICTLTIAAEVGWIGDEFKLRSGGITFDDATTQTTAGGGGGSGTVTNIAVASSNYTANLKIDAGSNITITHTGQVVNIAGAAAGGGGAAPPATNTYFYSGTQTSAEWIQDNGYSRLNFPDVIRDQSSGAWTISTNLSAYTAPVDGVYSVTTCWDPSTWGATKLYWTYYSIGGGSPATQNNYTAFNRGVSGGGGPVMSYSADIPLVKNQKLEIWQRNNEASANTCNAGTSTNGPKGKFVCIYLIKEGF